MTSHSPKRNNNEVNLIIIISLAFLVSMIFFFISVGCMQERVDKNEKITKQIEQRLCQVEDEFETIDWFAFII